MNQEFNNLQSNSEQHDISITQNHNYGNKSNNRLWFIIGIILLIVVGIVIFFTNNKKESNDVSDDKSSNNEVIDQEEPKKEYDNLIIPGVEYIDASRDINNVSSSNFSFFIDDERKDVLTYINNDENSKIKLEAINNIDGRVAVFFTNGSTDIIVSNENYLYNGKKLNTDTKELLFDEDGLKCYVDKYNDTHYTHYYVTNIDGVETSFYAISKTKGKESITTLVKELITHLSVNDEVGFYLDRILNVNWSRAGVTLKSSSLIGYLIYPGSAFSDKLVIDGYEIAANATISSWEEMEVFDGNVVYGTIGDKNIGYHIEEGYSRNNLIVYVYKSEMIDGVEYFANSTIKSFKIYDYDTYDLSAEDFVKLIVDNLVQYEE